MQTDVTFRHMDSSDALRSYCEEKLTKIATYLFEPVHAHVVLSVEKIRQIAEIDLSAKDFHAHALEDSDNLYSSIDLALDKLETQVRKHKEKVKNHKNQPRLTE